MPRRFEAPLPPVPRAQKPPPNHHGSSAGTNASSGTRGYPRDREASANLALASGERRLAAKRSREMRDGRIAGDNQIQILHDRRGIDESIWPSIEIVA